MSLPRRRANGLYLGVAWLGLACVCGAQQTAPLLQINSPSPGTIVNPGQTTSVSVSSPANASFTAIGLIPEQPMTSADVVQTAIPATFSISVPIDIDAGPHMLTAMGATTSGQTAQSATILIDVERPDMPTALSAQMPASQVTLDGLVSLLHAPPRRTPRQPDFLPPLPPPPPLVGLP